MPDNTAIETLSIAYLLHNSELEKAHQALDALQLQQKKSEEKIRVLEAENALLREQLQLQQMRRFGKKSESENSSDEEPTASNTLQTVASYTRSKKKCGRTLDTSTLPRHRIIHDLAENEKTCACCQQALHLIGKDISEQLEVIPARYCVIEHVRMKYGCRQCQHIVMAPKPQAPLPKALAGASLLTDIIIDKYQYHLPLYRQSKIMASYNMIIPDNTLGNWVMQSGLGLLKLYDALWSTLLKSAYLQVDETPVKLLKPEKKGYLWAYFSPLLGKGLLVFEMSASRTGKIAEERLAEFIGLLQTDGYAGYNNLRKQKGIVGLGCFSHARRKFNEVIKITSDKGGIAAEMIERMKPLYALEARMRELKYSHRSRKYLRQKNAWPIIKELKKWLIRISPQVPPKSALGKAIQYTLNQWPYLIRYLRHGRAEIDTNWVENKIREVACGKKNWLFFGHVESGKIHALFYSLIISCVLNNLNPRVYLHYILTKIHDLRKGTVDAVSFLPHIIDQDVLQKFAAEQIELGKRMLNSS
jgi:transposase